MRYEKTLEREVATKSGEEATLIDSGFVENKVKADAPKREQRSARIAYGDLPRRKMFRDRRPEEVD